MIDRRKIVGVAEHRPVRMWMRCRNPDKRKDALDEVAMKIWKSRNRKIKVPNKFRAAKRKAPTNECKCLIIRVWSHLG